MDPVTLVKLAKFSYALLSLLVMFLIFGTLLFIIYLIIDRIKGGTASPRNYAKKFRNLSYLLGFMSLLALTIMIIYLIILEGSSETEFRAYLEQKSALSFNIILFLALVTPIIYLLVGYGTIRKSKIAWKVGMVWYSINFLGSLFTVVMIPFAAAGVYWGWKTRSFFDYGEEFPVIASEEVPVPYQESEKHPGVQHKKASDREKYRQLLNNLEERLASGEISEETYAQLKEKYEKKLEALEGEG